jgi:hypothetical protein
MMLAAVRIRIYEGDPTGVVFLLEVDENYSLDRVQTKLVDGNPHVFGPHARVSCEIARFKSIKKLLAWAERKRRRDGLPPLTGWYGPWRLAP